MTLVIADRRKRRRRRERRKRNKRERKMRRASVFSNSGNTIEELKWIQKI